MRAEQFLSEGASRFGSRPAIVADGRPHSYSDLARNSDRVAAALMSRGVKRGDRVAFFMDSTFAAVVSAFAVLKAGAVISPIDPTSDAESLGQDLDQSRAVGLVTDARHASVAAAVMASAQGIRLVLLCGGGRSAASGSCLSYEDVVGSISRGPDVVRAGVGSDTAILFQGSFSKGETDVDAISHAELVAAAECQAPGKHLSSVLSYDSFCQLLAAIRSGATLVLETPSVFRRAVRDRVDGEMMLALNG